MNAAEFKARYNAATYRFFLERYAFAPFLPTVADGRDRDAADLHAAGLAGREQLSDGRFRYRLFA